MSARQFATFNPNALGPTLELELGGLVVASNANSTDKNRVARSLIGSGNQSFFFEAVVYGDEDLAADQVFVGIVKGTARLDRYVGYTNTGYGLDVGGGGIYYADVEVESTPAAGKEIYIGVFVSFVSMTCTWFINGSPAATVSIDPGIWYPAISLGNTEAYKKKVFVSFGQRAFAYPVFDPNSGEKVPSAGVYRDVASPSAVYLCPAEQGGFQTGPDDALPIISFDPRILNASGFTITRRGHVWLWGNNNSGTTYGSLDIDNFDGAYDRLLIEDWRDQPILVAEVPSNGVYDDAHVVAVAIVDSVTAVGETVVRVTLKDKLSTLERPVQTALFPPFMDEGVANRPVPIVAGACRNIAPPLMRQTKRLYSMSNAAITNIGAMRDKGALLNPNYSPPQYTPANNLRDVVLETLPVGVLTADVSSEGDQIIIPGADDILSGNGQFNNWTVGPPTPPTGWAVGGNASTFTRPAVPAPQLYAVGLSTPDTYNPTGVSGQDGAWLETTTAILQPGKTYRINFRLMNTQGLPSPVTGGMGWGLMVRTDTTTNSAYGAVSPNMIPLQAPAWGGQDDSYTFVYTVPPGAARKLYFIVCASRNGIGTGFSFGSASFYGIRVELLGEAPPAPTLYGVTLESYMRRIFETQAGLTADDWVSTDCAAIDTETRYKFGVYLVEPITVREAADKPLDSFCATQITDRLGRIRTLRLRDPARATELDVVAYFDSTNIAYGMSMKLDLASGLTSTIGARANNYVFNDSDFVTDYNAVPAALRTQFKRRSQFWLTAAASPAASYLHALNAPPLDSLLDDPVQAQLEIDQRFAPYAAGRAKLQTSPRFIEFTCFYDGDTPDLMFGDIIKVTYDRFGLQAGQLFMVVATAVNPYNKSILITAWSSY